MTNLIFFGSFLHYSALILEKLIAAKGVNVIGVVTTPAQPAGRNKELKKTEVQVLAEREGLPVLAPNRLDSVSLAYLETTFNLPQPNGVTFLTAGYGKLLPDSWLTFPTGGALNLHFSLLPAYRGANPAEWAILMGETKTGVTLIEMSPKFDTGHIVAQAEAPIGPSDTRETVYQKLYALGGEVLPEMLTKYDQGLLTPTAQPPLSPTPYAKRLTREDGFIAWEAFVDAMAGRPVSSQYLSPQLQKIAHHLYQPLDYLELDFIARTVRALLGFPGVWTIIPTPKGDKRMKILEVSVQGKMLLLEKVQIEGQQPANWNQVKNSVI
ncbi:MAG TPA: methionyl-tRNA formyltransferase [Patescibacteria group bacterium]